MADDTRIYVDKQTFANQRTGFQIKRAKQPPS